MLQEYYRTITAEMIERYTANGAWPNQTLYDALETAAQQHPHRDAFVDSGHRLTFQGALTVVRRLANHLLDLDVGPGWVVGLQSGNQVEFALMRHALSAIGAVSLSLPAALRRTELEQLLAAGDADAFCFPVNFHGFSHLDMAVELQASLPNLRLLLGFRGDVPDGVASLDHLLGTPHPREGHLERLLEVRPDPNQDDIMSTTAGSTGLPKLFVRTHNSWNGMARNVLGCLDAAPLTAEDRLLALAPLPQGLGYVTGLHFAAVTPGLTTVYLEDWNPEEAVRLLVEERCTAAAAVPAQMIQMLEVAALHVADLSAFRVMVNGGAPLPRDKAEEFEKVTGAEIIHGYGASDVGTPTFNYLGDPPGPRHASAGRVEKYTTLAILDDFDNVLPADEVGEIAMAGPDVVSGYYKDEAATKSRYGTGGLTRLGDLGYLDKDGYLHVVGRKQQLILRGGQNISAAEIEELISGHPGVSQVAVVGAPDPVLGERVWAYVVPRAGGGATANKESILEYLRGLDIAAYKLPEEVVILQELPMNAGGKVLKPALREMAAKSLEQHRRPDTQ